MTQRLLKNIIPSEWRRELAVLLNTFKNERLKKQILNHYKDYQGEDNYLQEALRYLESNNLKVFPYPFQDKYEHIPCEVLFDSSCGLHYVLWMGKRLYFKRSWSKRRIVAYYRSIFCEQDTASAHCYLPANFTFNANDVIADIGCAEANFTLTHIDTIQKAILVERDHEWIEALEQTFKPYLHKIKIINKYAGSHENEHTTTLDAIHKNNPFNFLKMDLDGSERPVFEGGHLLWNSTSPIYVVVCTYHQAQDAEEFKQFFESKHFACRFTEGYMLFIFQKQHQAPFFRKGVLRAIRL
jgi:hypothetical protein